MQRLLIVPYGIETLEYLTDTALAVILLIVPYGIETRIFGLYFTPCFHLLIVPYGIETAAINNDNLAGSIF